MARLDFPDCSFKAKSESEIVLHRAWKHDIGVDRKGCPHCDFETKSNGNLDSHIKVRHEIHRELMRKEKIGNFHYYPHCLPPIEVRPALNRQIKGQHSLQWNEGSRASPD